MVASPFCLPFSAFVYVLVCVCERVRYSSVTPCPTREEWHCVVYRIIMISAENRVRHQSFIYTVRSDYWRAWAVYVTECIVTESFFLN